jgi:hypothetical protein
MRRNRAAPLISLIIGAWHGWLAHPCFFARPESPPGKQRPSAPKKTVLRREIEATDRQIDRLVYELYGLTEEDIVIVEEAATR